MKLKNYVRWYWKEMLFGAVCMLLIVMCVVLLSHIIDFTFSINLGHKVVSNDTIIVPIENPVNYIR